MFNHILKVPSHPNFGEAYLLTGSGADVNGSQMVVNDLIDTNGNSVWSGAIAYNNSGDLPYKGLMALYRKSVNRFIVLHSGHELQPSITILNGNNGSVVSNGSFINGKSNLINGMMWENPAVQNSIVFSGY